MAAHLNSVYAWATSCSGNGRKSHTAFISKPQPRCRTILFANLELGLEQHRREEYAKAASSYAIVLSHRPDFAPVIAMLSECQIRLDRIPEAAKTWRCAEDAARPTRDV